MVIAHRGACGYRPEHTIAAYELAVEQGADAIELDVVPARDGTLVVRHESELSVTTDVASRAEFADRRKTKTVDGVRLDGWFAEDFEAVEVRQLYARQRFAFRGRAFDDRFFVPTLADVLQWARAQRTQGSAPLGVLIELKDPAYFASIGRPLQGPVLASLAGGPEAVWLMSFESDILRSLSPQTSAGIIQLVEDPDRVSPQALSQVATYATGIGPWKGLILPSKPDGSLQAPTRVIEDAHGAGLSVFAWTFRSESQFLAPDYGGVALREYQEFARLGVDGFITDFPDAAAEFVRLQIGKP